MDDPTSDAAAGAADLPAHPAPAPRPARERAAGAGGRVLATLRRTGAAVLAWRPRRPRHGWWSVVGLVLAGLVVSVVFGVTTASVQGALGPHVTRYDVTTDATVTIDFGPLGTLQIDSPLPATLGVRATVQEIPAAVTELGEARTLQALADDAQAYVAFFSGPAAAVRDVAVALVTDVALRSAGAFVVLVVVWCVVRALLGRTRRDELVGWLTAHARPVVAGGLALVVGATVLTSSVAPGDRPVTSHLSSAVFDGTPLQGARVTGRLGGVIDTYGAYAVNAWRANEEFYQRADHELVVAWRQWELDAALEEARRAAQDAAQEERDAASDDEDDTGADDGTGTDDDGTGDGGTDGDGTDVTDGDAGGADPGQGAGPDGQVDIGSTVDEVTPDPSTSPSPSSVAPSPEPTTPEPEVEPVVLVVVSDLHCNVGMAPLIGTLAELSGAAVVLDAGDTTMNGTSVEQYCVTSFARAVPPGVALVTSPGNHDSRDTSARYARAGATVLDGSVVDVAGLRILGDHDPNETRVGGGGTTATSTETVTEAGVRLAQVACDDAAVDLLLVHTPTVGDPALDEGCVPAQVSGHYHRRVGPDQVGLGVRLISSSTAGATLNQPTVGPLRGVAELTVLRFDPVTRLMVDYQVVQVTPQATVVVGARQPWPQIVEPQDEDVEDLEDRAREGSQDDPSGDDATAPDGQDEDVPARDPDDAETAQSG